MVRDQVWGGSNALLLPLVCVLDVKWMFGIEGWNEGFDLLRISLGMEFP